MIENKKFINGKLYDRDYPLVVNNREYGSLYLNRSLYIYYIDKNNKPDAFKFHHIKSFRFFDVYGGIVMMIVYGMMSNTNTPNSIVVLYKLQTNEVLIDDVLRTGRLKVIKVPVETARGFREFLVDDNGIANVFD